MSSARRLVRCLQVVSCVNLFFMSVIASSIGILVNRVVTSKETSREEVLGL